MSKRNSYESPHKKIPIRSPRSTRPIDLVHHQVSTLLKDKYLSISINAFLFRKVQDVLVSRHIGR
jgi:hypothetical protein